MLHATFHDVSPRDPPAFARRLAELVVQQPPLVIQPRQPLGEYEEAIEDPWIGGLLTVKSADEDVWTARWLTQLGEYPRYPVTVQVVGFTERLSPELEGDAFPSASLERRLAEGRAGHQFGIGYRDAIRDLSLRDWSEVLPFLMEIGDNPGERERRLVYADYLDDLGLAYSADSLRTLIAQPGLWFASFWAIPAWNLPNRRRERLADVPLETIRRLVDGAEA